MRRVAALLILVGAAACSSGGTTVAPTPSDPVAAGSGVLVVPSIVDDPGVLDLEVTDAALAATAPLGVPDQAVVLDHGGRRYPASLAEGPLLGPDLAYAAHPFRIGGRRAAYQESVGCRPDVLVADGGAVITVAADGADRSDLVEAARGIHVRRGRLVVDRRSGWREVAALRPGWLRSAHGTQVEVTTEDGAVRRGATVVPLVGTDRAALDELLCRRLGPLHTGISGTDRVPLTPWNRQVVRAGGAAVTIGKLATLGPFVATVAGDPARALLLDAEPADAGPRTLARLVRSARLEPGDAFHRRRESVLVDRIRRDDAAVRGLLALAGKDVYASGRDDDVAWIASSVFRRGVGRLDDPAACLTIVRDRWGTTPTSAMEGECLEAHPAPAPLRVAPTGASVIEHLWGTTDASVAAVEVAIDGWVHRVPTVAVDRAGLGRVFVVAVPSLATVATAGDPTVWVLRDGPIRIRALRADGSVAGTIEWGVEPCPTTPSRNCTG